MRDSGHILLTLLGAGSSFITFCLMRFPHMRDCHSIIWAFLAHRPSSAPSHSSGLRLHGLRTSHMALNSLPFRILRTNLSRQECNCFIEREPFACSSPTNTCGVHLVRLYSLKRIRKFALPIISQKATGKGNCETCQLNGNSQWSQTHPSSGPITQFLQDDRRLENSSTQPWSRGRIEQDSMMSFEPGCFAILGWREDSPPCGTASETGPV